MSFKLGSTSRARLAGVHPRLVAVVERAIQITGQDFTVLEGVRTQARQLELYAQGRTTPGPVVTWTKTSNHFKKADGYGHAVDIAPFPIDWSNLARFDAVAKAMFQAGAELRVKIRWGADWNANGEPRERGESDSPHFELA